jgi:hypothetical protein
MPITVTFDEVALPAILEGLIKAEHSLSVMHSVFREMPEHEEASAGFEVAATAVTDVRKLIDDALQRAVAELN